MYFAKDRKKKVDPVVVKALIDLGTCLNLDVHEHRELVEDVEQELLESRVKDKVTLSIAINALSRFYRIDSVRKTIEYERSPANFMDSFVYTYTRTMIAVRNTKKIGPASLAEPKDSHLNR